MDLKRKYDYYIHENRSYYENYFGYIGYPIKVCIFRYYIWKLLKFRVTKVLKNTPIVEVIVQAALNQGASSDSYKIERIKKTGADEEDWRNKNLNK